MGTLCTRFILYSYTYHDRNRICNQTQQYSYYIQNYYICTIYPVYVFNKSNVITQNPCINFCIGLGSQNLTVTTDARQVGLDLHDHENKNSLSTD